MFVLNILRFIGRHAIPAAVALLAGVGTFVAADATFATASVTAAETAVCGSDAECEAMTGVDMNGEPVVRVIGTYDVTGGELTVWSDGTARFEPYAVSPCDSIDWRMTDGDGSPLIPFDANNDGFISCTNDIELGS